MSNTNIQTIEGTEYKVTLNVSGVANLTDYRVEGSCKAIGSCAHGIKPFRVAEVTDTSVVMFIPTLASGSYLYQVFITRISTNQEFLVLEGRIDVSNKIKANEDTTIAPTGTVADVTLNAETVEVTVAITEGTAGKDGINGKDGEKGEKGDKGEQGERGEKGDAFTFDDFTPEQLASLKGEKGDPGESGGASIDWAINTATDKTLPINEGTGNSEILIGYGAKITAKSNTDGQNTVIGNNSLSNGVANTVLGENAQSVTSYSVLVGNSSKIKTYGHYGVGIGYNCSVAGGNGIAIGSDAKSHDSFGVTLGSGAESNSYAVSIGTESWTSWAGVAVGHSAYSSDGSTSIGYESECGAYGVAIGYQANSVGESVAIGTNAQADYGNITLKSGNVEVKFSAEGMTLNGEPYGQGGSGSGGSGTDYAQQMLYKVKYAHTDLYEVRYSQSSEWREYYDEYGNHITGYTWYPCYDDITSKGEWYYDLKTNPTDSYYSFNTQFYDIPLLVKFAAKIGGGNGVQTSCSSFFNCCNNLEEVIIECSLLYDCNNMFSNCPKVHTFYADLSKLEYASYMFGSDPYNCTSLNVESVEHIANSIKSDCYREIYIGMARELQWDNGDGKYSRCQEALQKIRNKGWTVYEMYSENY